MESEKHLPRNSFLFYRDWRDGLKNLSVELKAEVYDCIIDYALDGEHSELTPQAEMLFNLILPKLLRDYEKYAAVCARNKENGSKGGRPRKTQSNPNNPLGFLETQITQQNPENHDNDNENDNENGYDNLDIHLNDNNNIYTPEIEIEDPYDFEHFWEIYDKKVDKAAAKRKYDKLPLSDRKAIINYLPQYKEAQPDKKYRKDPCTFLNRRAWENEIIYSNGNSRSNTQQSITTEAINIQQQLFNQFGAEEERIK